MSEIILGSAREPADARHITMMVAIDSAAADLLAGEDEERTALGRGAQAEPNQMFWTRPHPTNCDHRR